MAKETKKATKKDGKKPEAKKITKSDVKEATNAAKSLTFPSDAPEPPVAEPQTDAPKVEKEYSPFDKPADAPMPPEVVEEVKHEVEEAIEEVAEMAIESVEEIVDDNIEGVAPPVIPAAPTQDELEERVFEKWWNAKNRPMEINNFELANDINMGKFNPYEGVVGKFKFKRSHAGESWKITVDETKK